MAHDEPGLAYADYFAAAAGAVAATLVPEVDAAGGDEDDLHLYGVHQPGVEEMFGARGHHMPPAAMIPAGPAASAAHGKAAMLGLGDVDFGDHHRQGLQAPLSLSLHGAGDSVPLALHHHQQLGGGVPRQQHQPAAWPGIQQQGQGVWHLRGSRFLRPTQQLLQEFCALPVDATSSTAASSKLPTTKPASDHGVGVSSSSSAPPSAQIQAMSAAELQRLKAKLYAMLQEVLVLLFHRSSLTTPHHTAQATCPSTSRISSRQEPLLVLGNLKSCMQVQSSVMACLGKGNHSGALPSAFGNLHSLACRCSNASVQSNL